MSGGGLTLIQGQRTKTKQIRERIRKSPERSLRYKQPAGPRGEKDEVAEERTKRATDSATRIDWQKSGPINLGFAAKKRSAILRWSYGAVRYNLESESQNRKSASMTSVRYDGAPMDRLRRYDRYINVYCPHVVDLNYFPTTLGAIGLLYLFGMYAYPWF
ncbi:hypothetical protein P170DRAFT_512187 [Aspergillus steynii IBT 23096]|uniref:Uncharacterized protein n=1 Tax=Aspergillus steynii IBT 23096 TaxID=1392250 RepID=A0A2I2FXZ8_9EURO|nr:uncharacterized protein P170DRAFT_512187 [Aspergillus steynii IBT 23096]PLB45507.1 hypothetical protein P170DRAFT_512187 [Aspergillus steynii IBT 23096]